MNDTPSQDEPQGGAAPEPPLSDASATPTPRRRRRLSTGKKLAFGAVTVCLLLGTAELAFRVREHVRGSRRKTLSPRKPDSYRGQVLVPNVNYTAVGGQVMVTNSLGMRAPEVSATRAEWVKQRILCVGGSTTFGLYTSANDKTWPEQVQRMLHERGYKHVEVLNGGVPAWDLRTSQTNLELRLFDLKPDVVICYHAYNDLVANRDEQYAKDSHAEDVSDLWHPLRASALYRFMIRRLKDPREQLRTKATELSAEGTAAYERNLRRFARRVAETGAKPFFCTYPSAFRPTLEESQKVGVPGLDRWFGELSPFDYPTLIGGLATYNDLIRKVATETKTPYAELEKNVPHDVALYRSTVHHSDEGEVEVAKLVTQALIESGVVKRDE